MNVIALHPRPTGGAALHPQPIERAGFHGRQQFSAKGLGVVIALHAAALTAVALVKTEIIPKPPVITEIFNIPIAQDPPPVPPPPAVERQQPRPSVIDTPPTVIETVPGPAVSDPPDLPPQRFEYAATESGTGAGIADIPDIRPPVRVDAAFDPRVALQPPYPSSELREQREGDVRVRVTIGADGRVIAVERLSATSDAFWRATERYAMSRWRFRPATLDGQPVESSKVLNLHFEITA